MSSLASLVHKQTMRTLSIEGKERTLASDMFRSLRETHIRLLCSYIRLQWEAKQTGVKFKEIYHDADWCNAAVQLLTYAPLELQDEYIRADDEARSNIVCAVLADGGVMALDGHFYELPPL